jgi:DNA-binding response OmpR family regulator
MAESKVLLIGDNAQVLEDIRAGLALDGLVTVRAASLHQALLILSSSRFPIVLIDLNMLSLDGLALCSWIRRFNTESRMVALCGHPCDPVQCRSSGFDEVWKGPLGTAELVDKVRRAISECGLQTKPAAENDSRASEFEAVPTCEADPVLSR